MGRLLFWVHAWWSIRLGKWAALALISTHEEDVEYDREKLFMGVDGFPLMEADDRAGVAVSYFDDWVSHPTADFYWNRSNTRERITRMNGPVHLLAGWFDPCFPSQLKGFALITDEAPEHVSQETRLVIGPWAHA